MMNFFLMYFNFKKTLVEFSSFIFFSKKNKHISLFIIYNLSFIILFNSCYTPSEGCLDIGATNFNASADESCEDCCTYPQLRLAIFHSITTQGILQTDTCINFTSSTILTNDNVNYYQLNDVSFYLSDFEMIRSNGDVATVDDTISLTIFDDIFTQEDKDTLVKNDFELIKRSVFNYNIGEFRTSGTFSKVRFKVGINKPLNTTDVDTLETTHPLSSANEMHNGDRGAGFILQQFVIEKDTAVATSNIDTLSISQTFVNSIPVELDFPETFQPGFNVTIPMKINYSKWFQGINFVTDTEAEIKTQIVSNTAEAFEIDN